MVNSIRFTPGKPCIYWSNWGTITLIWLSNVDRPRPTQAMV